jgi:hypothetical protein
LSDKHKGTTEYLKDGTLVLVLDGVPGEMKGKYKFLEEEVMEVALEIPGGAEKMTQKLKVKIDKDELSTTDEKGTVDKFKRKK